MLRVSPMPVAPVPETGNGMPEVSRACPRCRCRIPTSPGEASGLRFCPLCGTGLSLPQFPGRQTVTAPIAAPASPAPQPPAPDCFPVGALVSPATVPKIPVRSAPAVAKSAPEAQHRTKNRKRLMADLTVDSKHLERRETSRTLLVLGMFVVAAGLCAVVFHLMANWGSQ